MWVSKNTRNGSIISDGYTSRELEKRTMGRLMDFTTETPNCCEIGDILQVEEHKLPTSYWYMIEHAYGVADFMSCHQTALMNCL